ncbi:MAG: hypothetical protein HUU04_01125 [Verrucomicrobiae bacterium]|nr:hypothetical protein [Verrucomicrobiae bacterium]
MKNNLLLNEPLVDWRFLDDLPQRRRRPAWVTNEPIACVGAWETLFHRRRTGQAQVNDEELYAYEHTEKFVKEVLGVGATALITAYDKNYFVDEEEFALKKQLAAHCKRHGLKLGVYLRADQIYSETFADRLQREDLLARDARGQATAYGNQEWRKNVCFHKPNNLAAFKASIRRAITELGVDLLHLDGFEVGGTETVNACRCDACRRDFTAFLQRRWGDDPRACKRRFGHTHLEGIEPPGLSAVPSIPSGRVVDPVWQEWIRFRCTWTARVGRLVSEHAHALNPNVAILGNNALAVRENAALLCGYDSDSYCRHVDIMCNEDGFHAHLDDAGRVIQRARQHKLATGAFLFNYMHNPALPARDLRRQMAHAAAFNAGRVTCLGHAPGCYADFRLAGDVKRRFLDWLHRHWEHYQNLETIADVTVWREARAMALAEPLTYATAMQCEQLLIEDRTPLHIVAGDWPADTRVLVLPDLAFLDDAQCDRVTKFVQAGGNLLVIGQTSTLDGWGRRRGDFGLRPVLPDAVRMPGLVFDQHAAHANDPIAAGQAALGDKLHWARHQVGAGRVVYIPELVAPSTQPSLLNADHTYNFGLDLTNWRVPERADELRKALAWLLGGRPTFAVRAKRGVLANYYRQRDTGRLYAHLVNLHEKPVGRITVGVAAEEKTFRASVLTPDRDAARKLTCRASGERGTVTLENLDVYAVIVIETANGRQ